MSFGEYTQFDDEFGKNITNISTICSYIQIQQHLKVCWNIIMECVENFALKKIRIEIVYNNDNNADQIQSDFSL